MDLTLNLLFFSVWHAVKDYAGIINSPFLLKVTVPFVEKERCRELLRTHSLQVGAGHVCAGGKEKKDSCVGDSGGPLMWYDRYNANWVLSGIVSLGPKACGTEDVPGLYTKVDEYIDWIEKSIV